MKLCLLKREIILLILHFTFYPFIQASWTGPFLQSTTANKRSIVAKTELLSISAVSGQHDCKLLNGNMQNRYVDLSDNRLPNWY